MSVDRAAEPPVAHVTFTDRAASVQAFAASLKALAADAGFGSARALAKEAHLSHETVASAFRGRTLPSAQVVDCVLAACGLGPERVAEWERARAAIAILVDGSESRGPEGDPADGRADVEHYLPVADHVDPDDAGCYRDAVTVMKQRIRRRGTRNYLGWVELRYCPVHGAAWGRFHGLDALEAVAARQAVDIDVAVHRVADAATDAFRHAFAHDYHWSGLLVTGDSDVYAEAQIIEDGELVGSARTRPFRLAAGVDVLRRSAEDRAAVHDELVELRRRVIVLEQENAALRRRLDGAATSQPDPT